MDRQHGRYVFECDSCDEVLDVHTKDWEEAKATMRRDGWHARLIADVWLHGCPNCGAPT